LITQAVVDSPHKGDLARNVMETLRMLRNDSIDRELTSLKLQLAQPGLAQSEAITILNRQAQLRPGKHEPMTPIAGTASDPF
jgi:hypothetical protein